MHYFHDDINIKNLDPDKIKIDEKSYKNILIYYIGHVATKSQLKTNSVNHLYLIFNKKNVSKLKKVIEMNI